MPFHHEKLIVSQRALEFAAWSQILIDSLTKKTSTRDHLEHAGDSIALNIAEGNGKFSLKDRARLGLGIGGLSRSFCRTTLPRADAIAAGKLIFERL
jgi:hypothetical protein